LYPATNKTSVFGIVNFQLSSPNQSQSDPDSQQFVAVFDLDGVEQYRFRLHSDQGYSIVGAGWGNEYASVDYGPEDGVYSYRVRVSDLTTQGVDIIASLGTLDPPYGIAMNDDFLVVYQYRKFRVFDRKDGYAALGIYTIPADAVLMDVFDPVVLTDDSHLGLFGTGGTYEEIDNGPGIPPSLIYTGALAKLASFKIKTDALERGSIEYLGAFNPFDELQQQISGVVSNTFYESGACAIGYEPAYPDEWIDEDQPERRRSL